MNCQVNDLAIVVKIEPHEMGYEHNGKIVRCVAPFQLGPWIIWQVDPKLDGCELICDKNLRPLRNPGDDEVDETLVINKKEKENV